MAYETNPINKPGSRTVDFGLENTMKNSDSETIRDQIEQIVRRVIDKIDLNKF